MRSTIDMDETIKSYPEVKSHPNFKATNCGCKKANAPIEIKGNWKLDFLVDQ